MFNKKPAWILKTQATIPTSEILFLQISIILSKIYLLIYEILPFTLIQNMNILRTYIMMRYVIR